MYRLDGLWRFALMEALDFFFFPLWGISLMSFAHYTLIAGVARRIGPLLVNGPRMIRWVLWLTVIGSIMDSIENTLTLRAAVKYQKLIGSRDLQIRNLACNIKFFCFFSTIALFLLLLHVCVRVLWHRWTQRRPYIYKTPELIA